MWLKAERDSWVKSIDSREPQALALFTRALEHWKVDRDLASIREPEAQSKLSDAERTAWRAFWAEVDTLLGRLRPIPARPQAAPTTELPDTPFAGQP